MRHPAVGEALRTLSSNVKITAQCDTRRAPFLGRCVDHGCRIRIQSPGHNRSVLFDDPCLFMRNGVRRVSQILLMVQSNGGDHRDQGRKHVRGVEATSQADFDNGILHAGVRKVPERHGGRGLEERRRLRQPGFR